MGRTVRRAAPRILDTNTLTGETNMAKTKAKKVEQTQDEKLQAIGRNAFECIAEMVARLDTVGEDGEPDDDAREKAQQEIQEDPLSVQVRSDWCDVGADMTAGEFCILVAPGGPAVRIVGDLDEQFEPIRARLETHDWRTPWTEYRGAWGSDVLLTYARQFTYGAS